MSYKQIITVKGSIGEGYGGKKKRKKRKGEMDYLGDWDETMEVH